MLAVVLIVVAAAYGAAYVWMGFALGAVFGKIASPPGLAWVPIRRYVEAAKAGDVPTLPIWIARE